MEIWKPIEDVTIPEDKYTSKFCFGQLLDYDRSSIYLEGNYHRIRIDFADYYCRVFDRSLIHLFLDKEEVEKYAVNNFREVVYEVQNSNKLKEIEFKSWVLLHKDTQKYFIIIVENVIVELISMNGKLKIDIERGSFERGTPWKFGKK